MDSLQWNLEQLFCPSIDPTLIAAIVNDHPDFDTCFDILSSLAEAADSVLDGEEILFENESSPGNSSSNFRNSSIPSSGEPGDGSITSLECSMDSLSLEDELDYASTCSTTDYECDSEGNIEFLKSMFPMFSEVRVGTLLRENGNNVELVVDVILNEMYLETEQEKDFSYLSSPFISVKDPNYDKDISFVSGSQPKHRKKKRLRKQKQNEVIFQNNGHRPNSNKLSPVPRSSSSSIISCWTKQSKNTWNKSEYESQDGIIDDKKLCQLMSMFPDHNFESLKQVLINCNGEVQSASDILSNGNLNGGNGQGKGIEQTPYTSGRQTTHLLDKEKNDNIQNQYYIRISPDNKIYDEDDNDIVDYEDGYDPEYCHKEVYKYFKKRDESFKNAAQSYRKGARAAASYHSEEGWKFDKEMKRWKLRAARSLVKKHSVKNQDEHVLDLHGCFVNEALIIVKEWLNDWYSKKMTPATKMKPLKPLKIITGKGNHSPNGVAKLPNAIMNFLDKDNWKITKDKGYVLVHGFK